MAFLRATATATPRGDRGRFIATKVTPAVRAGVQAFTQVVYDESQNLVPVKTGHLKSTGGMRIEETEKTVRGVVEYTADYALHVEYIVFSRVGSRSYLRPALDTAREAGYALFKGAVSAAMKS